MEKCSVNFDGMSVCVCVLCVSVRLRTRMYERREFALVELYSIYIAVR